MVSRLLKLDDVRHIESPEKIAFLFQKLGYNASAQQLAVDDLELSPRSAEAIWKAHLIADQGKGALQVLLFQLQAEEFSSPAIASNRMRAIAQSLGRRPSNFLLLGTRDYNQLMLVNPRKSFDAQMNLKTSIRKLLIDRTNPTNYDRDRLEAIAARDLDPEKLYKAQCEAFDVEKLTKQFYTGYEKLFDSVQKVVQQHNPHPYFEDPSRLHQFTQRLLGRTMFLYFLQKKEFLGGDRNFLTTQYRKLQCASNPKGMEFYSKLLEPLFFETLNKQRPNLESEWGQIPYLNGGLFDWDYGVDIQDTAGRSTPDQIQLPNSLFDFGSANGILGFFNGYNFTVAENVQGDEDVAVDPEMLGKVFENLLAKEERGQSGTFYTPRDIVHFMCVESLSRYLADSSGISLDTIKQLIELDPDSPEITFNQLLSKEQARSLKQALDTVKICDPAVGSGAFPLSMMQVILAVRQVIARREGMTVQRGRPIMSQWKRDIIANNLYGVDIKPEAIEIAKLRMWLSLVVDVPTIEDLDPLPNLDYKLMCGNSLISTLNGEQLIPDPTKDQQLALNVTPTQAAIQPLLKLQQQYYSAQYEERKILRQQIIETEANVFRVATANSRQFWESKRRKLEQDIRRMGRASRIQIEEQQLIAEKLAKLSKFVSKVESGKRSLSFFQYHLHFNDVFQEKGGFDIVIGNPPYVKEYTNREAFDNLRDSPYYQGKMDLWYLFACTNIDFLKKNTGILSFIATNNWQTNSGASILRNKIISDTKILTWLDFGSVKVFESADVQTMILICMRDSNSQNYNFDLRKVNGTNASFTDVSSLLNKHYTSQVSYLNPYLDRKALKNKSLVFADSMIEHLLNKIFEARSFTLDGRKEVAQGIVTPQDSVIKASKAVLGKGVEVGDGIFILSNAEKTEIAFSKEELNLLKPFYTTSELHKYFGNKHNSQWIIYTDSSFKDINKIRAYPNVKKHLDKFQSVITSDNRPYGLHRSREQNFFQGEKIISVRKCSKPTFTYTDFDCYVSQTFYVIKTDRLNLKFLTALLNSKVIRLWLQHKGKMQGHQFQIDKEPLLAIPLVSPPTAIQMPIIQLVDQLLTAKAANPKVDISAFESKIDQLVYRLYGLTSAEINIIENSFASKLLKFS